MRRSRAALLLLSAAMLCALALGLASLWGPKPAPTSVAAGGDGRSLVWLRADGTRARLGDWAGKPVAVLFWSRYCEMCLRELPEAAALMELAEASGARLILSARVSDAGRIREVEDYLQSAGLGVETLYDVGSASYHALGLGMTPSAAAFDAEGRLVATREGAAWTSEMLLSLLGG